MATTINAFLMCHLFLRSTENWRRAPRNTCKLRFSIANIKTKTKMTKIYLQKVCAYGQDLSIYGHLKPIFGSFLPIHQGFAGEFMKIIVQFVSKLSHKNRMRQVIFPFRLGNFKLRLGETRPRPKLLKISPVLFKISPELLTQKLRTSFCLLRGK